MTTLAISFTHAAHLPERRESFRRLVHQVDLSQDWFDDHVEADRMPHWEWSERQWQYGAESEAGHTVVLQDDVTVCDDFYSVALAIASACGDRIVSLFSNHPAAPKLRADGHRYYTSSDGLVGNGYILSRGTLESLLEFRERAIVDVKSINEDTLIDLFAMATGRLIYHAIPSPIDHDTSLPSTWGADGDDMRRPCSLPEPGMAGLDWTMPPSGTIPHVGRVYRGNHWRLLTDIRPQVWQDYDVVGRAYALEREAQWKIETGTAGPSTKSPG